MKVLYIGSGLSALQVKETVDKDHLIVCLNNAWRLFRDGQFDVWIHSGDFPAENFPKDTSFEREVSYSDYSRTAREACERFDWITRYPEHHIGYTAFFQGLYWIMMTLTPRKIGLLGFDHDYNREKVEKWSAEGFPMVMNNFNNKKEKTIEEWSERYFDGFKKDFFYGHGTPDPLRHGLGPEHIGEKMILANNTAEMLGIELVNYSNRPSPYNVFKRDSLY